MLLSMLQVVGHLSDVVVTDPREREKTEGSRSSAAEPVPAIETVSEVEWSTWVGARDFNSFTSRFEYPGRAPRGSTIIGNIR